jgi:hypothetical protein
MSLTTEQVNPLAELPVLGVLASLVDKLLDQLGFPFWLRTFAEIVVTAAAAYLLLKLLARHVLPWAGAALVGPMLALTDGLRALLLLPDLGISRLVRHFGGIPPEFVYGYGAVVMSVIDGMQEVIRHGMPKLSFTRFARPWLLVCVVALLFLVWNGTECVPHQDSVCVSPVSQWTSSVGSWIDELGTSKK